MSFAQLDSELWLAARLQDHRIAVFDGLTTREQRKERARSGCREFSQIVIGTKPDGKPENYAEAFERIYGEAP